ncbi:MAG: helix-turn-helix transcriptional regulator [Lachnospiraceae bacterium]|nr:helix-turn-helix transcriptional regulator [Lachnospiraceae bacterium]
MTNISIIIQFLQKILGKNGILTTFLINFSRVFKKVTDTTPKTYRKAYQFYPQTARE